MYELIVRDEKGSDNAKNYNNYNERKEEFVEEMIERLEILIMIPTLLIANIVE